VGQFEKNRKPTLGFGLQTPQFRHDHNRQDLTVAEQIHLPRDRAAGWMRT
jgi:hypothetical protein